jgi:hypothetical protein
MKRAIACVLLLMLALAAFGQEQPKVYVKSVPILKILSHPEGYKVLYMKSDMKVGEFYIPHGWLSKAGGKAEMVFGRDPSYPYFSVFYRDGKFDYVRLYVIDDVKDLSWGILRKTEASNAAFGVDTLQIEY